MNKIARPLYDADPHAWYEEQASLLRDGRLDDLDAAHLIEELEDLGRSERDRLFSSLRLILTHLLKWRHQPERRTRSWTVTIERERVNVDVWLTRSPSLKSRLPSEYAQAWRAARRDAAVETGLPPPAFPEDCPFTLEQALEPGWLP